MSNDVYVSVYEWANVCVCVSVTWCVYVRKYPYFDVLVCLCVRMKMD